MDVETAVRELGSPGGRLPAEALQWALDHWNEAASRLLQIFDAYLAGEDTSDAKAMVLFFAVHLFAEQGDRVVFDRLCRLLQDNEATEDVLGEAVTGTLQQLLISTCLDGRQSLAQLIETPEIDGFVRHAAFQAWAWLTFTGVIPLDETQRYLLKLYDCMQPQAEDHAWFGFVELIALLGLKSHRPLVKKLFNRGLLDPTYMDLEYFDALLARGAKKRERAALFEAEGVRPFADTIATLGRWACFSGEAEAAAADDDRDFDPEFDPDFGRYEPQEPVTNPLRHVGRNDPCPCGSGKKFKKCCLGRAL